MLFRSNLTGKEYQAYNNGVAQVAKDVKKTIGNISPEEAEFLVFGAHGKEFRKAASDYHSSRTDLKKPSDNKFKYIYKAQQKQQAQQQAQATQQRQQSAGSAEQLWNEQMQNNSAVAQKFRSLSRENKLEFQTEFVNDVSAALRNGTDINQAIQNLLHNYQDIHESRV